MVSESMQLLVVGVRQFRDPNGGYMLGKSNLQGKEFVYFANRESYAKALTL